MAAELVSVSFLTALLLLQSVPVVGTVPVRNIELDAAHACITQQLDDWLREFNWQPTREERWRWAQSIVGKCDAELEAAAKSDGAVEWHGDVAESRISPRHMLRAEAHYFVDRLVREHWEKKAP